MRVRPTFDPQKKDLCFYFISPFFSSRDGGIRTHDLQHPMLARYRATLHPEIVAGNKYKEVGIK